MINFVNLNMLGFMFNEHHPFLYLLCMPILRKTCLMFMFDGIMTKLSMQMLEFMTSGHHPFPYLLCMPVQKENMSYVMPGGL
jgi:hypothetical protein